MIKGPHSETSTIPLVHDERSAQKEALKTNAQWIVAVANQASARASLEKADTRLALLKVDFEQAKALSDRVQ